jgi:hypothetical protein
VWFSTSSDLVLDAQRDLTDLGNHLKVIDGCKEISLGARGLGLASDLKRGVLFSTYATLVSSSGHTNRLAQIVDWCGGPCFDGCLVFDEGLRGDGGSAVHATGLPPRACFDENSHPLF